MKFMIALSCLGLVLAPLFAIVVGIPCHDLSGTWRNQLGSNMTIERVLNSYKINGQYNTSVESTKGAATFSSNISGLVQPTANGSLVAFNVLWNHGASLTAWVGQCMVCDGQEKIHTSWVLRSHMPRKKRWMTTRINQDTFWRVDDNIVHEQVSETTNGENAATNTELLGKWISLSGDSLEITRTDISKSLEGTHENPDLGGSALMFGTFDGNQTYTALGLAAARPNEILGWAGHIYSFQEHTEIIETSWLSHAFSIHCNNPRKNVGFGMNNYIKQQPTDPAQVR